VVGDFNGDGKQDLAVANATSDNVSILLGDGAGNFSVPTNYAVGNASSVAVGDFNGDGRQDLAVTWGISPGNIAILLGDGAGNFSSPTNFAINSFYPKSVVLGDFNGDGKQDLAATSDGGVWILLGDGSGHFSAPTNIGVGYSLAVGDLMETENKTLPPPMTACRSCYATAQRVKALPPTRLAASSRPARLRPLIMCNTTSTTGAFPPGHPA
jgi:hypothetical protein